MRPSEMTGQLSIEPDPPSRAASKWGARGNDRFSRKLGKIWFRRVNAWPLNIKISQKMKYLI